MSRIICIVEGHGEVHALPRLIHRIADEVSLPVHVPQPIRVTKSKLLKPGELERYVTLAASKTQRQGRILVLVDSDSADNGLAGELSARVIKAAPDVISASIVAVQEYECWLIAGLEGLHGKAGLSPNAVAPSSPESIGGAKGWLSRVMPRLHPYSETEHQPIFTAHFDMAKARIRSPSFAFAYNEITRLLRP
jgi:hypothetical protein